MDNLERHLNSLTTKLKTLSVNDPNLEPRTSNLEQTPNPKLQTLLGRIFAGNLASMADGTSNTSFKDYLEEQMDLKRPCTIKFRDVQGAVTQVRGHIVKMEEVSGREIIETDAGFIIGMDQIISVNDRPQANYC